MSEKTFLHNPRVNPGLARDRAALLVARDILSGSTELNWIEDLEMFEWQGVALGGSPPRVAELDLSFGRLTGRIALELGLLTNLRGLNLEGNDLKGSIPPELGNLINLRRLNLRSNRLTGAIPLELGGLANLMVLNLGGNALTGVLPRELINRLQESRYYRERGRRMREALNAERRAWLDDYDWSDEVEMEDPDYEEWTREQERELADWSGWPWADEDNYNREAPG